MRADRFLITVKDTEEKISTVVPILDELAGEGLVMFSDVNVIKYTQRDAGTEGLVWGPCCNFAVARRTNMNLHEEIATVAYELFESRGCIPVRDLDDWLDAERIVLARHAGQEIEEPEEEDSPAETAEEKKTKAFEASYAEDSQEAA